MTKTTVTTEEATMATRTERDVQKRRVDLSVLTLSALMLSGGYLLAARVDGERAERTPLPQDELLVLSPTSSAVAPPPPIAGLIPAPTPHRRRVVVRRTRAS